GTEVPARGPHRERTLLQRAAAGPGLRHGRCDAGVAARALRLHQSQADDVGLRARVLARHATPGTGPRAAGHAPPLHDGRRPRARLLVRDRVLVRDAAPGPDL